MYLKIRLLIHSRFSHNQKQSRLLALPAELRNKIYSHVFEGYACRLRRHSNANPETFVAVLKPEDENHCSVAEHLAWTKACHQLRSEAYLLFFELTEFESVDFQAFQMFVDFLNPRECYAIRNVRVQFNITLLADLAKTVCSSRRAKRLLKVSSFRRRSLIRTLEEIPVDSTRIIKGTLRNLSGVKRLTIIDGFTGGWIKELLKDYTTTNGKLEVVVLEEQIPSNDAEHHCVWLGVWSGVLEAEIWR
jgi:hypothetical protein